MIGKSRPSERPCAAWIAWIRMSDAPVFRGAHGRRARTGRGRAPPVKDPGPIRWRNRPRPTTGRTVGPDLVRTGSVQRPIEFGRIRPRTKAQPEAESTRPTGPPARPLMRVMVAMFATSDAPGSRGNHSRRRRASYTHGPWHAFIEARRPPHGSLIPCILCILCTSRLCKVRVPTARPRRPSDPMGASDDHGCQRALL
jgi:hypothetical protein